MTSDHADRQILDDLSGQPEVKQDVGVFGSQDRLNEAPRNGILGFELNPMVKVLNALTDAVRSDSELRMYARGSITFWCDGDECGTVYLVDDETAVLTTTPREGQPG